MKPYILILAPRPHRERRCRVILQSLRRKCERQRNGPPRHCVPSLRRRGMESRAMITVRALRRRCRGEKNWRAIKIIPSTIPLFWRVAGEAGRGGRGRCSAPPRFYRWEVVSQRPQAERRDDSDGKDGKRVPLQAGLTAGCRPPRPRARGLCRCCGIMREPPFRSAPDIYHNSRLVDGKKLGELREENGNDAEKTAAGRRRLGLKR
jgi:hypothetical protein